MFIYLLNHTGCMNEEKEFNKSLDSHLENMGGYLKRSTEDKQPEKIDWKEWIPLYGPIQVLYDINNKKPNLVFNSSHLSFYGSAFYHGFLIGIICSDLLGRLIK